jgi:hypothetical protein
LGLASHLPHAVKKLGSLGIYDNCRLQQKRKLLILGTMTTMMTTKESGWTEPENEHGQDYDGMHTPVPDDLFPLSRLWPEMLILGNGVTVV